MMWLREFMSVLIQRHLQNDGNSLNVTHMPYYVIPLSYECVLVSPHQKNQYKKTKGKNPERHT